MNNKEILLSLSFDNAVCVVGNGGVGKTKVLETLYKNCELDWNGNVLFIHAPSRLRENYPSFIVNKRRDTSEMDDILNMLEKEEGIKENVSSSKEIIGIIYTFLRNGVINKDSMIIVDSLDSLMDTKDLKLLLSIFETLRIEKDVRLVLCVSSIIGVRAIESTLSKVEFFEVVRGKERIEIEKKEKSEDVYSFFLSLMEDL